MAVGYPDITQNNLGNRVLCLSFAIKIKRIDQSTCDMNYFLQDSFEHARLRTILE